MANVTSSQVLNDGPRNFVIKVTCVSDGTDETDVVKVDASAQGLTEGAGVSVQRIDYSTTSVNSMQVEWDGSTDALITTIPADNQGTFDWRSIGGIHNNATAPTGDITVTSTLDAGDDYSLVFYLKK